MNPFLVIFSGTGGFCTVGQRRKVGITDFSFPLKTVFRILEDIRPEGASGEATLTPESEYSAVRIFPGSAREFFALQEILYCMSEILRETQNCFSIFEKPITPMVFIEIMIFKKKMMVCVFVFRMPLSFPTIPFS